MANIRLQPPDSFDFTKLDEGQQWNIILSDGTLALLSGVTCFSKLNANSGSHYLLISTC